MKKTITSVLALVMLIFTALGAISCGKPPEYAEIEARFVELVEASYEINKVIFGEGLPTDERVYSPLDNMKTFPQENGKTGYYSYFEDKNYGQLLYYSTGYGKNAEKGYLKVELSPRDGETPVYQIPDENKYFYNTDYKEPEGIRYYSSTDPENYDYVAAQSQYQSIEQIKMAAESIYSLDYLNDSVYEWLFIGVASADEENNLEALSARYIEYSNADEGNTTSLLMMSNTHKPLVTETRKFDFSTARVVKPGSKKLVNIEVETYLEGSPDARATVTITMVKVDGVWYLDSPTY